MKKLMIYEFQLKAIHETLRLASNIHNSEKKETCFDRSVIEAKAYAENALNNEPEKKVKYV